MTRAERAKAYFMEGYNCSQAVAMAFSDLMGMSEQTVAKLTSGFGGGVGRMREVCGSITGMTFVMSALYGYDDSGDARGKQKIYAEVQKLSEKFREENGSIVCRELLGLSAKEVSPPIPDQRTNQYYRKRPCAELVECSAEILEDYINERQS